MKAQAEQAKIKVTEQKNVKSYIQIIPAMQHGIRGTCGSIIPQLKTNNFENLIEKDQYQPII